MVSSVKICMYVCMYVWLPFFFNSETGDRTMAYTIIEMNNVEVLLYKSPEIIEYWALHVGYGNLSNSLKAARETLGYFSRMGVNITTKKNL